MLTITPSKLERDRACWRALAALPSWAAGSADPVAITAVLPAVGLDLTLTELFPAADDRAEMLMETRLIFARFARLMFLREVDPGLRGLVDAVETSTLRYYRDGEPSEVMESLNVQAHAALRDRASLERGADGVALTPAALRDIRSMRHAAEYAWLATLPPARFGLGGQLNVASVLSAISSVSRDYAEWHRCRDWLMRVLMNGGSRW